MHSQKLDVEEYGQNKYGGGHHGGISVDSDGYSLCPIGDAIDGLLKLGLRTKNFKQYLKKNFQIGKQEIYVTIVVGVLIRLIQMKIIQYQKKLKNYFIPCLYSWFTYVTNISKFNKKEHR